MSEKELETILVTYEQFCDIDFVPKYPFYFKTATGDLIFIKTRSRQEAQDYCDEWTGQKGKYKIIAAKQIKTKPKLESGLQTVYATQSRARPSSRPPK